MSGFFRLVGLLVSSIFSIAACIAVYLFFESHPGLLLVVGAAVVVPVLLVLTWFVLLLWERIYKSFTRVVERSLEIEAKRDAIEAARDERRVSAWAKVQELRLKEFEQRVLTFPSNHVLALRGGAGGDIIDIPYVPVSRLSTKVVQSDQEQEVITADVAGFLPSPSGVPSALELVRRGIIGVDDEIVLGVDAAGKLVKFAWKRLKALLILGLQGGGKTTTAVWIIIQVLLMGGRLALIDKHAKVEEDSMYEKIKPFASFFVTPVGDSPQAALRVISYVRNIYDERLAGAARLFPLLLVVDEFTAILRQKGSDGKWAAVAEKLAALVEDLNFEGRKLQVYAVCIGQAANASRTGGTEIRETFNTRIVHVMREQQARLLGLTDEKKEIKKLATGQVCIDMEGLEPFYLFVPFLTDDDMKLIASFLLARRGGTDEVFAGFPAGSNVVLEDENEDEIRVTDTLLNVPEHLLEPLNDLDDLDDLERRVLDLRKQGQSKAAIIYEVWGVKKGGSEKYRAADLEYERIITKLVGLGYLQQATMQNSIEIEREERGSVMSG